MTFSILQFLEDRREGRPHDEPSIHAFIRGILDGSVSRAQAAAWLAFAFVRGLSPEETVALTRAMTVTGETLSWDGLSGPFVDKHSTGGVGDKVSLVLAPLWAELGRKVPMVSGRGLGHTGGTLDKLEAIPGYRTDLTATGLRRALETAGCFINGQTGEVAPADRILYALRNETATVPSIPLITASILSKKLSEGIGELVLDVKVGSGAFMKDLEQARALARSLVRVGNGAGVQTRAFLTDMSQPLGLTAGNALEVEEVVECLQGGGPPDLFELTVALAGDPRAAEVLRSGAAWPRFQAMVAAHGGEVEALEHPRRLRGQVEVVEVRADRSGLVTACDALGIGHAAFVLGAGRSRADQGVHPGVGVRLHRKRGDPVRAGDLLAEVFHAGRAVEEGLAAVRTAFRVGDDAVVTVPAILDQVH